MTEQQTVDRVRPDQPTPLPGEVRFWLPIMAAVAGSDSAAFLGLPTFIESNAYDGARQLAPQWAWGTAAGIAAAGMATSIAADAAIGRSPASWAAPIWWARAASATIGLAAYGAICAVFGTSILALSLTGVVSAITGTTKWWVALVVCARILIAARP